VPASAASLLNGSFENPQLAGDYAAVPGGSSAISDWLTVANGVEWSLMDGGVGYNSTVLIQGPGQQGLSQTVICKQAGASLIIVTGTSKDGARMDVAKKLGADYVIDVQKEDPLARIMEITGGKGVDVALDCTAGAGTIPILLGSIIVLSSFPTNENTPQSVAIAKVAIAIANCDLAAHEEEWKVDEAKNLTLVTATLVVDKENHKRIVIGLGGQLIRDAGTAARLEIEKTFGKRFFLDLHVVARPGWREDPRFLGTLSS